MNVQRASFLDHSTQHTSDVLFLLRCVFAHSAFTISKTAIESLCFCGLSVPLFLSLLLAVLSCLTFLSYYQEVQPLVYIDTDVYQCLGLVSVFLQISISSRQLLHREFVFRLFHHLPAGFLFVCLCLFQYSKTNSLAYGTRVRIMKSSPSICMYRREYFSHLKNEKQKGIQ